VVRTLLEAPSGRELTATRLCTETPRAGGRVFETGDEILLQLARDTDSAFLTPVARAHVTRLIHTHGTSTFRGRLHEV
jgi:hypothetical protein